MTTRDPIIMESNLYLLDGYELGEPGRTGAYVMTTEDITIIETGPSSSASHIREGLKKLNISLEEIKNIIVTHIHLDHSGGVGLLLEDCPHARVIVHPKGAQHLVDPQRLVQGAKLVFGELFHKLFDPVVPVPEGRIEVMADGQQISVGQGHELTFIHTEGHAKHHLSIIDMTSNSAFTGDVAGIRYKPLADIGVDFYLPSTSPTQFDPHTMLSSLKRLEKLDVKRLYFSHFGYTDHVQEVYLQVAQWIETFMEIGEQVMLKGGGNESLTKKLFQVVEKSLNEYGIHIWEHPRLLQFIQMDLHVNAMGILHYLKRNSEL